MVAFLGVTVARAVAAPLNPNYTKVESANITDFDAKMKEEPLAL